MGAWSPGGPVLRVPDPAAVRYLHPVAPPDIRPDHRAYGGMIRDRPVRRPPPPPGPRAGHPYTGPILGSAASITTPAPAWWQPLADAFGQPWVDYWVLAPLQQPIRLTTTPEEP
ncbi:MAG: hypothetical protein JWO15_3735 [Sphingomonadales bacterium]|nr:hypothetical protein [Sphingomonadales bacterium]